MIGGEEIGVGVGEEDGVGEARLGEDSNGVVGMMVGVVRRENSMLAIKSPG